ncbi:uncharacterized protein BO97DRAFT_446364 [Aspergillus homomorphus CBS 101889]|uniref:Uncharacterized protein n=1 Tax=Aspergillus homomorphus (strain CBS 101889) TaxID=1450537 RepID=A0A395HK55_ASPHC|nr:hypothetical protein BO97DRAFT_446364 [Aspergillus homomorphus CBS 101889]RAL08197.1 hypothetical protein BO97DRAFT_446364 [Aspergillus homomorphus CBS 101889]
MPSTSQRIRIVLTKLYKDIVLGGRGNLPADHHVGISGLEEVEHVVGFDFEKLDDVLSNLGLSPPVHFCPMNASELKAKFPLDYAQARDFRDYGQEDDVENWVACADRCHQIFTLIEDRATREAMAHQGLDIVEWPDSTLYLEGQLAGPYPSAAGGWFDVPCILEPQPVDGKAFPHLALHLVDEKEARENSILFSEFAALIMAMRGRVNQRKVDSETEREELYNNNGKGKEEYPYLFPDEEYFPVLLLSYVRPQHARIFAASVNTHNVANSTLRSWRDLKSGSGVTPEQYLLYRVIRPQIVTPSFFNPAQFGITNALLTQAQGLLSQSPAYMLYISNFGNNDWTDPALGPFGPVVRLESEVSKGWRNDTSPQGTDEDTVNSTFIEFLNALTSIIPAVQSWWRTYKKELIFDRGKRGNKVSHGYSTRTDGQLEDMQTEEIKIPVECKGFLRGPNNQRIAMQEVSELVAWIKQCPDGPNSAVVRYRPLVSRDGNQIFISFLEYGPAWVDYLRRSRKSNAAFATLHSYGPYKTTLVGHTAKLAELIVAMSLLY